MTGADLAPLRERVLILVPTRADAEITDAILRQAGIAGIAFSSFSDLCVAIEEGVGAVILVEEALGGEALNQLNAHLAAQPAWSSTPFIVLTRPVAASRGIASAPGRLPGALLIERPVRIEHLLSAVRSSIDARRRQYAMRDILEEARRAAAERAELLKIAEESGKQAQAANRMKDEFLAVLSHELRTPLNAILGWAALLRRGSLDPEQATRAVESIERNSKLQAQLIDDLLDVSRVISGSFRLDVRPVELDAVIEEAIATVMPASVNKGVKIVSVSDGLRALVQGDPARLQQIVWNLLTNAIKFTPRGGTVAVESASHDGFAEVRVADSGEGIAPEFLPHVFERFRQADSSTTRQRGGLGLGLAIVRQLVELHGGTVEASSVGRGQGSTFTVRVPLIGSAIADGRGGPSLDRDESASTRDVAHKVLADAIVLIVDDDRESLQMAAAALSQSGACVYTADSASSGLSIALQIKSSAIVCDISMPGEDGFGFLRRLQSLDGMGSIPAIALTAHARDEDKRAVREAGFRLHLAKPVDPAELVRAVREIASVGGEQPGGPSRDRQHA